MFSTAPERRSTIGCTNSLLRRTTAVDVDVDDRQPRVGWGRRERPGPTSLRRLDEQIRLEAAALGRGAQPSGPLALGQVEGGGKATHAVMIGQLVRKRRQMLRFLR